MGRTVPELLDSVSSREIAEWQAYERVSGPIDNSWRDEATAQLIENTHDLLFLFSKYHFEDPKKPHIKGPIKEREKSYPRPHELYSKEE